MAIGWGPKQIHGLIVVSTGCLCLPIIVFGTFYAICTGAMAATDVGTIAGLAKGGGILGLGLIVVLVIRMGLQGANK